MKYELIQQFQKKIKSGKTEQFREYIEKNNLTDEFLKQCFASTFRRSYEPGTAEYKQAKDLSSFVLKLSRGTFEQKFGPELTDKFTKNIYESKHPSIGIFNTVMLMNPDIKVNSQYEAEEMIKLFDFASEKDMVVGTHIIGSDIGDKLSKEGISLTGHKWVANDYGNRNGNIKGRLEKNITFFENDPINFITHIIRSRGYNNPTSQFNDIVLVSIPKEELEKNEENIIVQKDIGVGPEDCLNPEYIKGFVRVSTKEGNIEEIYSNPIFKDRSANEHENTVQSLGTDDWKSKFKGWYEQANTSKIKRVKNKVMNFLREISNKNKEKSTQRDERDI